MPDARTSIAIFGMTCVEPHVESKRFIFRLLFKEVDSLVHDEIRFVTKGSIGELFEKWVPSDHYKFIELCYSLKLTG